MDLPRMKRPISRINDNKVHTCGLPCEHLDDSRKEEKKPKDRVTKRYTVERRLGARNDVNIAGEKVIELLESLRSGVESGDFEAISEALHRMRGALYSTEDVDTVVSGNIYTLMDACLELEEFDIQHSVLWILSNIACGDSNHVAEVAARLEKISPVIKKANVAEETLVQGLRLLANVAGDSPEYRDLVVRHFSFEALRKSFEGNSSAQVLEDAVRLLSNIARQGPRVGARMGRKILESFYHILGFLHCECRVVSEICKALLNVLHYLEEPSTLNLLASLKIMLVMARHPYTVQCTQSCLGDLVLLIADLLSTSDELCEEFIDQGILNPLSIVLHGEICELYQLACFAIANVFAGNPALIQRIINKDLLKVVFHVLEHGDLEVRREAAIALCCFVENADHRQLLYAIKKGMLPPVVRMLDHFDASIVTDILASLLRLLCRAKDRKMEDELIRGMDEAGIVERLQTLVDHDHHPISQQAEGFIHLYLVPRGMLEVWVDASQFDPPSEEDAN
ncbi:importin subunit alpha-3 [Galendromus occidentalis]|uniref:Importin subunit alpha-3 n=1 Tax=Galendromus occidentalis TaxID=34638 RepID=A0AAJ6QU92_9ACAR|nr:importin subunit alpha-3 [Galendromus occidentalis]